MVWNDDAAKELVKLGSWALIANAISYKPKINSRTVQGERTGARAQQEGGTSKGGVDIVVESRRGGGILQTVIGASVLSKRPGQLEVPSESRADVSAHGFWKMGARRC